MATTYIPHGWTLSPGQKQSLATAIRDGKDITLRLSSAQLQGEDKLGLTNRQLTHIMKKHGSGAELKFSKTQLEGMRKMGGILPLLPLILGGLSAAGALTGGAAGVAKAVQDKQANAAAQAETERHNREIEKQLQGSGLRVGRKTRAKWCPTCKGNGLYLSTGQKTETTEQF